MTNTAQTTKALRLRRSAARKARVALAAAVVAAGLALPPLVAGLVAPPAHAAFPGANGKIAFVSARDGNKNVYTMNPDGTNVTPITVGPFLEDDPAISPDGKTIAYTRQDLTGNVGIYVKPLDDSGSNDNVLVGTGGQDRRPTWSPDGTKIAFVSNRDGNVDLYIVSSDIFDSAQPTHLTDDAAVDTDPVFSPNGKKIAFASNIGGNDQDIYKINSDGSSPSNVTKNAADDFFPDWGVAAQ